jgi:hypothetical protein
MKTIRITVLVLALCASGFAGAQALATESAAQEKPLVATCVDAADGWAIEVYGLSCQAAGDLVRRLASRAPRVPVQAKGMTCAVAVRGRLPIQITCAGGKGRFLWASAYLSERQKTAALEAARCPDRMDRRNRRWAISRHNVSCTTAQYLVSVFATWQGVSDNEKRLPGEIKSREQLDCRVDSRPGIVPRLVHCSGFGGTPTAFGLGAKAPVFRSVWAYVKPAATPSTNGATTTVRRP